MVVCTGNEGKVKELRALLPSTVDAVGLTQVGLPLDLPETGDTLEANALEKARYAHARCSMPCLADDTGLEVDALNGRPGVRSARYASEAKDAAANMRRLLSELQGKEVRAARFRTVLAYVAAGVEFTVEGCLEGIIIDAPRGAGGFGYDPVFVPLGHERTLAEMDLTEKNGLSHRAVALRRWTARMAEQGYFAR